jgi:Uncharacterized distant relative of homeotic protein bithoraxoid
MTTQQISTQDLGWLLSNFAERVPGVAHAVAVSADGLLLAARAICRATARISSPPSPPDWSV